MSNDKKQSYFLNCFCGFFSSNNDISEKNNINIVINPIDNK